MPVWSSVAHRRCVRMAAMENMSLASILVGLALWAALLGLASVVSGKAWVAAEEPVRSERPADGPALAHADRWRDRDEEPGP